MFVNNSSGKNLHSPPPLHLGRYPDNDDEETAQRSGGEQMTCMYMRRRLSVGALKWMP